MTEQNSAAEGDDQSVYSFSYDHGRMPFFMKVLWLLFLAFSAWYMVEFLLEAVGEELAG